MRAIRGPHTDASRPRTVLLALAAAAGLAMHHGAALAQCEHLGQLVNCPPGVPTGSVSVTFLVNMMGDPVGIRWRTPTNVLLDDFSTAFPTVFTPPMPMMPGGPAVPADPGQPAAAPPPPPPEVRGLTFNPPQTTLEQRGLTIGARNSTGGNAIGTPAAGAAPPALPAGPIRVAATNLFVAPLSDEDARVTPEQRAQAWLAAVFGPDPDVTKAFEQNLVRAAIANIPQRAEVAQELLENLAASATLTKEQIEERQREIAEHRAGLAAFQQGLADLYNGQADRLSDTYGDLDVDRVEQVGALVVQDGYVAMILRGLVYLNSIRSDTNPGGRDPTTNIYDTTFGRDSVARIGQSLDERGAAIDAGEDTVAIDLDITGRLRLTGHEVTSAEDGAAFTAMRLALIEQLDTASDAAAEHEAAANEARARVANALAAQAQGGLPALSSAEMEELDRVATEHDRVQGRILAGNPLLTVEIDPPGYVFSTPLWRYLAQDGLTDEQRLAALDMAIDAQAEVLTGQLLTAGSLNETEELIEFFGHPALEPLRQMLAGEAAGIIPGGSAGVHGLGSLWNVRHADEELDDVYGDIAFAGAGVVLIVLGFFTGGATWVVLLGAGAVGAELAVEGDRFYEAYNNYYTVETTVQAGIGANRAELAAAENQLFWQGFSVVLTVAGAGLEFADAIGSVRYLAQSEDVGDAFRRFAGVQTPGVGQAAGALEGVLRATDDPAGVLARVPEGTLLRGTDVNTFVNAGLGPQSTVVIDGRTFHLSAPFEGPGGRTAVIGWSELSDGTVRPVTFYVSNSHAAWRVGTDYLPYAPAGGLGKGPRASDGSFLNEGSADLPGSLQSALNAHLGGSEVVTRTAANADLLNDAFFGPLDGGEAFTAAVSASNVGNTLIPPGTAIDPADPFAALPGGSGPLEIVTSYPVIGNALYPVGTVQHVVRKGDLELIVTDALIPITQGGQPRTVRAVWVTSVQDAGQGVSDFGPRVGAYDAGDITGPPIDYIDQGGTVPVRGMDPGQAENYGFNPNFGNDFSTYLANNVPEPGLLGLNVPGRDVPFTAGGTQILEVPPSLLPGGSSGIRVTFDPNQTQVLEIEIPPAPFTTAPTPIVPPGTTPVVVGGANAAGRLASPDAGANREILTMDRAALGLDGVVIMPLDAGGGIAPINSGSR